MKPNDAALREALVNVLDTFGVPFEDVNRNGSPTLSFQINRMMHRFSYNAASEEGNGCVRRLANLLVQSGFQPRPQEAVPPNRPQQTANDVSERPESSIPQGAAGRGPPKPATENLVPTARPVLAEMVEPPPAPAERSIDDEPPPRAWSPVSHQPAEETQEGPQQGGVAVYRPQPAFAPAEVLVFEAAHDYLITKGEKIVIPVHQPDLMMHLAPEEFARRYRPYHCELPGLAREPEPARAANPKPPARPKRQPPPEAARTEMRADRPQPVQPPPERLGTTDAPVFLDRRRVRANGVLMPAQLGRIIAGIRQASLETGKAEVTSSEAKQYMPPSDRRQISARIHPAVKAGWIRVKKNDGSGNSYLYGVTRKGHQAIVPTAVACYTASGLAVPPFIEEIARTVASARSA